MRSAPCYTFCHIIAEVFCVTTRILHIELPSGAWRVEKRENQTLAEQLGGIGRSLAWIRDHCGRVADPFAPENPLIVNVGVLTGSKVMTGLRTYFTAFSPLKRSVKDDPGVMYSAASGNLGQEIAFAGIHDIIIRGACEKLSYLWIEGANGDVQVELFDATPMKMAPMSTSIHWMKDQHQGGHYAVIGPAGEVGVRYACIGCSTDRQTLKGEKFMRFAGRGGMGAVMGSKNLLAIGVKGNNRAQQDFPKEIIQPLNKDIARGEETSKYRDHGTWRYNVEALTGPKGGLPVFNFSQANHPDARRLYTQAVEETHHVTDENCVQCGIKCWKIVNTKGGTPLAKVDYEPCDLLGPNIGIFDIGQICELIWLCDDLGVDAITMGGVLGYMMENKLDGLTFGDFSGAKRVIEDVCYGRNQFAALGVKAMSEQTGIKHNAVHVHGLELAAYLGNTDPAAAFAIAGNHMSMATYGLAGNKGVDTMEEWLDAIPNVGLVTLLNDMSGVCKFAKVDAKKTAQLLNALGINCAPDDLKQACLDLYKLAREIDKRQGFTADDDVLPDRCYAQIPGQGIPQFNTREFFSELKAKVYERLEL
jgi:aldehyde:ferredoxin oxidoreductase